MQPRLRSASLLFGLVLAACGGGGGGGGPSPVLYAGLNPEEPTAGTWQTWLVAGGAALRPAAPPDWSSNTTQAELDVLRTRAAARGAAEIANVTDWNDEGACAEWCDLLIDLVKSRRPPPPKAARILGLCSVAMYDAAVCAFDAKYFWLRARPSAYSNPPAVHGPEPDSPSYVSERAAISAAAARVLGWAFPLDAAAIHAKLSSAFAADLDACIHFPSDVDAGRVLGEAVGDLAVARAGGDHGDDAQPTYVESGLAGRWARTPQNNGSPPVFPPVLPGWGGVLCWYLGTGSEVRPPAPPAYGSPAWVADRDEVLSVNLALTPSEKAIADLWADGGGTATPPGHWAEIAVDACVSGGLNECRTARVLALLNTAQHDAFVACWECKYFYDVERPIAAIRRDVAGQESWLPYITTPPFPSYPSGHSSTSGAAGAILAHLFPAMAQVFTDWAVEAKDSRLLGGIHFRFDNDAGLVMGQTIAARAILRAQGDGAP